MTGITTISIDNKEKPIQQTYSNNHRVATDKYWSILFIFVFIFWITSWHYAITHHKIDRMTIDINDTIVKSKPEVSAYIWGNNWVFDLITCNVAFLGRHYERSGSIVIIVNVLLSLFLIAYSLASLRIVDDVSCKGITFVKTVILINLLIYRLVYPAQNLFDEKIRFCLLTETIFIMIWYIKKSTTACPGVENKIPSCCRDYLNMTVTIIPLFFVLLILFDSTSETNRNQSWSPLFYIIAGGSIYVGLTIYYFALMVISCTTSISIDMRREIETSLEVFEDLRQALFIVGRYHFGTACYHATLIFPRIRATLIMNEKNFKKYPEYSKISDRLYMTHWKVHGLSLTLTAVHGYDYSKSIRELLNIFANGLPISKYFQKFGQVFRSVLAFLLSMNSLIFISLWVYGIDDPNFSMAMWWMYIIVMTMCYIICIATNDAMSDTSLLYLNSELLKDTLSDSKLQIERQPLSV